MTLPHPTNAKTLQASATAKLIVSIPLRDPARLFPCCAFLYPTNPLHNSSPQCPSMAHPRPALAKRDSADPQLNDPLPHHCDAPPHFTLTALRFSVAIRLLHSSIADSAFAAKFPKPCEAHLHPRYASPDLSSPLRCYALPLQFEAILRRRRTRQYQTLPSLSLTSLRSAQPMQDHSRLIHYNALPRLCCPMPIHCCAQLGSDFPLQFCSTRNSAPTASIISAATLGRASPIQNYANPSLLRLLDRRQIQIEA